jgi:hypothetical protein
MRLIPVYRRCITACAGLLSKGRAPIVCGAIEKLMTSFSATQPSHRETRSFAPPPRDGFAFLWMAYCTLDLRSCNGWLPSLPSAVMLASGACWCNVIASRCTRLVPNKAKNETQRMVPATVRLLYCIVPNNYENRYGGGVS